MSVYVTFETPDGEDGVDTRKVYGPWSGLKLVNELAKGLKYVSLEDGVFVPADRIIVIEDTDHAPPAAASD